MIHNNDGLYMSLTLLMFKSPAKGPRICKLSKPTNVLFASSFDILFYIPSHLLPWRENPAGQALQLYAGRLLFR